MGRRRVKAHRGRLAEQRPSTVSVVDIEKIDHLVTLEAHAAHRPDGTYETVCGRRILPAAMATGPNQRCWSCRLVPLQMVRR